MPGIRPETHLASPPGPKVTHGPPHPSLSPFAGTASPLRLLRPASAPGLFPVDLHRFPAHRGFRDRTNFAACVRFGSGDDHHDFPGCDFYQGRDGRPVACWRADRKPAGRGADGSRWPRAIPLRSQSNERANFHVSNRANRGPRGGPQFSLLREYRRCRTEFRYTGLPGNGKIRAFPLRWFRAYESKRKRRDCRVRD